MKKPKEKPTKLLWVDLEMTGLDAQNDFILEVAAEITDFDLKKVASYQARLKYPREQIAARMALSPFWAEMAASRDDFLDALATGKSPETVEQELADLVQEHFGTEPAILAGNSIHADRSFIRRWWPKVEAKLHYRMLDVTSLKVYMQGKYDLQYEKKEVHRAFDDIQESIAEWQFYIDWLSRRDEESLYSKEQ